MKQLLIPTLAAVVLAAAPTAVVHADQSTWQPKPRNARPALQPLVGQLMVKLRNPDAVERVQALGLARMQTLSESAGVELTAVRAMSGDATVVSLPAAMPLSEANAVAARVAANPQVQWAVPDLPVRKFQSAPPDAGYLGRQWNLFAPNQVLTTTTAGSIKNFLAVGGANLPGAWAQTRGAATVRVAVIDTGVTLNHPDLVSTLLPGYDFVSSTALSGAPFNAPANFVANDGNGRDADPTDPGDWISAADVAAYPALCGNTAALSSWHGTHMAGIVAGVWTAVNPNPPGTQTAGIAPAVKILPVRALGKCAGTSSDIIDAMRWSAGLTVPGVSGNANPAQIVNLSLGTTTGTCNPAYQSAVDDVAARGAVVVAASGNDGADAVGQPANCVGVIAVTAHVINGDLADYANIGAQTAISAPGGGDPSQIAVVPPLNTQDIPYYIWSALMFGATTPDSAASLTDLRTGPATGGQTGTSPAAAHVSAVAALLLSIDPTLTPSQVRQFITSTARPHVAGGYCAPGQPGAGKCGAGLLDASAAVNALVDARRPPPDSGGGALPWWQLLLLAALAVGAAVRRRPA